MIDKVIPAIWMKWPDRGMNWTVILQHDEVSSHIAENDQEFNLRLTSLSMGKQQKYATISGCISQNISTRHSQRTIRPIWWTGELTNAWLALQATRRRTTFSGVGHPHDRHGRQTGGREWNGSMRNTQPTPSFGLCSANRWLNGFSPTHLTSCLPLLTRKKFENWSRIRTQSAGVISFVVGSPMSGSGFRTTTSYMKHRRKSAFKRTGAQW